MVEYVNADKIKKATKSYEISQKSLFWIIVVSFVVGFGSALSFILSNVRFS